MLPARPTIPPASEEAAWWYKDTGVEKGPASAVELGRLAVIGILRADTLVWQSGFGPLWRRLDETDMWKPGVAAPPSADHGRWTKAFAKLGANPKARPGSWLGFFFGPLAYFYLGMWTKGLVITSGWLAGVLAVTLVQDAMDVPTSTTLPNIALAFFCAHNLKRDYYLFRVIGERVWPSLRMADNVLACCATPVLLMTGIGIASFVNAPDRMTELVAGVWADGPLKVVNDIEGRRKTITYGGVMHRVKMESVDLYAQQIVFRDDALPNTLYTFQKHHTDDPTIFTLDFLVNDELVGNMVYVRPS